MRFLTAGTCFLLKGSFAGLTEQLKNFEPVKGKWLELKTGGRWKRSKAKMKSVRCAGLDILFQAMGITITRSEGSLAETRKAARSVTVQCLKMRRVPRVAGVTLEWYSRLGGLVLLMAGNGHRYAPRLVAYSCSWPPFFSLQALGNK